MHTQTELQQIAEDAAVMAWAKFCRIYPRLKAFSMPKIVMSNRLKTTAGICYSTDRETRYSASLFSENIQGFKDIIIPHELAHQVTYDLFGCDIHGPKWQRVMLDFGIPADRLHSFTTVAQQVERNKKQDEILLKLADVYQPRMHDKVSFIHRDRKRVETKIIGFVTKVNLKTIKVQSIIFYNGICGEWTVPKETLSLRKEL